MSRENTKNIVNPGAAKAQASKIFKEFVEKKFAGVANQAARWLGTSQQNVDKWLKGTTVPGWALIRIRDDSPQFFFEGKAPVDPRRQQLHGRLDNIVSLDPSILPTLEDQIGICEDAVSKRAEARVGAMERALQNISSMSEQERERLAKLLRRSPRGSNVDRTIGSDLGDSGAARRGRDKAVREGAAGPHKKVKVKTNKGDE